jgi:hypothetical protein
MSSIFLEQRIFPSWFLSQRLINGLLDKAEEELGNPISLFGRYLPPVAEMEIHAREGTSMYLFKPISPCYTL